jgi:hypothetical protein
MSCLCQCGCGQEAPIATRTGDGYRKGECKRFVRNHNSCRVEQRYEIDPVTGCWLWLLMLDDDGYGREKGRYNAAHRNAYFVAHGEIPKGLDIHHRCETRRCVNPEHMELITPSKHARVTHATITSDIARQIKSDRLTGVSYKILAVRYGLSKSGISHVINGRSWKEA